MFFKTACGIFMKEDGMLDSKPCARYLSGMELKTMW
jgi:hypothetical protein